MRRFATGMLALALCATFSFADYHHHVDDGQQPDNCSACALVSLDSTAAPVSVIGDPPRVERDTAPVGQPLQPRSIATGHVAPRGPPACR